MSEMAVVMIGVLAFGGSIFFKFRRGRQSGPADDATRTEPARLGAEASLPSHAADLNPPAGRLAVPVQPPDPLVLAVCSTMPVEVTSVRLRRTSGTVILY